VALKPETGPQGQRRHARPKLKPGEVARERRRLTTIVVTSIVRRYESGCSTRYEGSPGGLSRGGRILGDAPHHGSAEPRWLSFAKIPADPKLGCCNIVTAMILARGQEGNVPEESAILSEMETL